MAVGYGNGTTQNLGAFATPGKPGVLRCRSRAERPATINGVSVQPGRRAGRHERRRHDPVALRSSGLDAAGAVHPGASARVQPRRAAGRAPRLATLQIIDAAGRAGVEAEVRSEIDSREFRSARSPSQPRTAASWRRLPRTGRWASGEPDGTEITTVPQGHDGRRLRRRRKPRTGACWRASARSTDDSASGTSVPQRRSPIRRSRAPDRALRRPSISALDGRYVVFSLGIQHEPSFERGDAEGDPCRASRRARTLRSPTGHELATVVDSEV